jgi:hypothetical protein
VAEVKYEDPVMLDTTKHLYAKLLLMGLSTSNLTCAPVDLYSVNDNAYGYAVTMLVSSVYTNEVIGHDTVVSDAESVNDNEKLSVAGITSTAKESLIIIHLAIDPGVNSQSRFDLEEPDTFMLIA